MNTTTAGEPITREQGAANLAALAAAIGPKPWHRRTATHPDRKAI